MPLWRRHLGPADRGWHYQQRLVVVGTPSLHALSGTLRRRLRLLPPLPRRHRDARWFWAEHLQIQHRVGAHRAGRGGIFARSAGPLSAGPGRVPPARPPAPPPPSSLPPPPNAAPPPPAFLFKVFSACSAPPPPPPPRPLPP